ncbi:MAG: ABC transporter ATP-binding protein [Oscillospiraceae bacterium]
MRDSILQTSALSKAYPSGLALDKVNMTVRQGDIYGFIGQNGAGKTTLIRAVAGLISPTEGEVALFGKSDTKGLGTGRKRIGCIVEGPAFYPKMSAAENLEYYRIMRGIPDKEAIGRALKTVSLTDTGKKKFQEFSLGMKQRLGLALAIMGKPDFLILDEPINGLDPMGIVEFRGILTELNQKQGMTVLISSHILSELTQVATTYGIIHQGRLIKEFSKEQLEEDTKRCISVKVEDTAATVVVLEQKLGTKQFEVLPSGEVRIYDFLDNPSEVAFQLSTNGVRIHSITEIGTNLEDYFLNTIGADRKGANNE